MLMAHQFHVWRCILVSIGWPQVDLPEVLRVKGLIRLGEAKAACR
jgi:hypothetical protein